MFPVGGRWSCRGVLLLLLLMYVTLHLTIWGTGISTRGQLSPDVSTRVHHWGQHLRSMASNHSFKFNLLEKLSNITSHSYQLLEKLYNVSNMLGAEEPHDPIYMQYRVSVGEDHVPPELKGGNPQLKTRTYPKVPRNSTCNKCARYVYSTVLKPRTCEAEGDIKVLIMITTVPGARRQRDVIRKTWLSMTMNNTRSVRYMWLLGAGWSHNDMKAIKEESNMYGDILLDDFVDSYFNLSIKVMGGFRFVLKSCQRAEYIMRSADDNYVNIPNILEFLKMRGNEIQDTMFGPCRKETPVLRDKIYKFSVTRNEYPSDTYPPYCIGTSFMMTYKTMKRIYKAAQDVPWFAMEDVYFGLVCKLNGIKTVGYKDFVMGVPKYNRTVKTCVVSHTWRAVHNVSPRDMVALWELCPQNKTIPS